ncbi:MAG: DUF2029 domain-containing protein, partial [Deltaproteobacteria bacterium]
MRRPTPPGADAPTGCYGSWVAWIVRVATPQRMRVYTGLMAAPMLCGLAWNYARGSGLLDGSGNVIGGDFLAFYTGARLFLAGRLAESYQAGDRFDFPAQVAFQQELLAPQRPTGVDAFVNPPHAVLFYLPFAGSSYAVGLALWWTAGLAALALSIGLLRRELPALRAVPAWRLFAACWLFLPTWAWFGYGQATALILLVCTGFFVLLRRGRDGWAGACLSCLAFKPQLAVASALLLLARGRWRALAAGAGGAAAWLAVGYALAPDAARAYLALVPRLGAMLRVQGYDTSGVQSFFGFAALLLDASSARAADLLGAALVLGALGWLAWRWWRTPWRPGTSRWDRMIAATFAIGWLASPQLYLYDLMLLLLPFAIVWSHSPPGAPLGGGPVLAWTAVVWLLAFLGTPLARVQLYLSSAISVGPFAVQLAT